MAVVGQIYSLVPTSLSRKGRGDRGMASWPGSYQGLTIKPVKSEAEESIGFGAAAVKVNS